MGLLEGKVAIVTGAGRGIGQAEAMLLAKEGCSVLVNDVGGSAEGGGADPARAEAVAAEIAAAGGSAMGNGDDVSSWEGSRRIVDLALSTWGRVDMLVNNAGVLRDRMSFNMSEDEWDTVVRVHLKGHFAMTRHVITYWRERAKAGGRGGRIVNTSSEAGLYGTAGQVNYAAAKAGIAALTITLARELGRYGVTVNAIAPRARTRLTENVLGEAIAPRPGEFDAWDPATVAPVVAWLCSDAAAEVSGQVFVVGGGAFALMKGWDAAEVTPMDALWTPEEVGERAASLFAASGLASDVNDRVLDLAGSGRPDVGSR